RKGALFGLFWQLDTLLVWATRRKCLVAFALCMLLILLNKVVCFGAVKDMTQELPDDYLGREFPWAFVVDLPDANNYLKYPGSKLWPMTKVRVNLRTYSGKSASYESTTYEELWYHYHLPVGLRRTNQVALAQHSWGAIIVCPGYGTA